MRHSAGRRWWAWVGALALTGCMPQAPSARSVAGAPSGATQPARRPRPRLLVLLVVDQLRADYLWRLHNRLLPSSSGQPGGFTWLLDAGASFPAAQYRHFPLFTGPGHACLGTGGYPYQHGIIGNDWYDRVNRRPVYCVDDAKSPAVGPVSAEGDKPMGPANLRASTLGDELKMATGGRSKVVAVSLKDRAAILLAGRLADAVIWYDQGNGHWISSRAYGAALPAWVERQNALELPASFRSQTWRPLLSPADAQACGGFDTIYGQPFAVPSAATFADSVNSKVTADGADYFKNFTLTPSANAYTLQTAEQAVVAEQMGRHDQPDLLCINLATNDYVGHKYGPNSYEALDITLQTDRELARFFKFLDQHVPGGLRQCTVALTADHGVCPAPAQVHDLGYDAADRSAQGLQDAVGRALWQRFHRSDLLLAWVEPYLWLDRDAIAAAGLDPLAVEDAAADAAGAVDGVYGAWSVTRLRRGQYALNDLTAKLARAVHPKVSGDVLVVAEALNLVSDGKYRTSHGSPYVYDTAVPLLVNGYGITAGVYRQAVTPLDVVATFAQLAEILPPSACEGVPLPCLK